MVLIAALVFALCSIGPAAIAAPTHLVDLRARQAITPLSQAQIDSFDSYTLYASAAYCPSLELATWSCGINCEVIPYFEPVATGGDGNVVQIWYVGYDPILHSVIVAHEGTNPAGLFADLTDLNIPTRPLNPTLFPGLSPDILVHSGFADQHDLTATTILAAVQQTMSDYNVDQIAIVGHSLGAALSLLEAVYLPLHITDATFTYIGYGLPRVGNQAFADYVDTGPVPITHINNEEDPIPTVPPVALGFIHPIGEVHIEDWGEWAICPGQENPSSLCTDGDAAAYVEANIIDHIGPYNGIWMGCGVQTINPL